MNLQFIQLLHRRRNYAQRLKLSNPKQFIYLAFQPAADPSTTLRTTDEFLSRLAGMMKFTINQRGGKASIKELAVATAQRETTIRLGLEWLGAGGHLKVEEENGELNLANGDGIVQSISTTRVVYRGQRSARRDSGISQLFFPRRRRIAFQVLTPKRLQLNHEQTKTS